MRLRLTYVTPWFLAATVGACSASTNSGGAGGNSQTAQGGGPQGGSNNPQGGGPQGGFNNPQGGSSNPQGGGPQGGSSNGGSSNGGSSNGGSSNGGSSNGGSSNGGSSNGGSTNGGSSNGGSTNGGSTNGGSSSGGSSAGGSTAGASTSGATPLSCTDPVYGSVTIPAANVISDFENNSMAQYVQEGRGASAEPWYAYAVDDVNSATNEVTTPSIVNPKNAANNFKIETTEHGPCSSKAALHVSSPGKAGDGSYAGFGIDFMARTSARKKQSYDASKYTGVGFWAKCKNDLQFAYFKAPDAVQDADMATPSCSYSSSPTCNQYGIKNSIITKEWTYYKLYFSEALQDPNGKSFGSGVDKSKLTAFQIHVNPFRPRSGAATANAFDCYIDDVHFLTDAAPTAPAATVTWTVSGNKLMRNGSEYKIHGLVRPSMEWDYAGFGTTREDAQRMKKKWHANTVRLAVIDTLWNGSDAKGNGPSYQAHVKRAVSWYMQQGMDVILDLHYVAGMPGASHATFWDTISKDAFFKDGRIIFELYNEPTGDFNTLQSWMQSTVTKIRANGANNLILVGGVDYSYDISGYVSKPVTGGAVAYVTHPYVFKGSPGDDTAFVNPAKTLPVVATEFGNAYVSGINTLEPTKCDANIYSTYMTKFDTAGMSWTSWAWIVDEWGCSFPQLIADYSGTPNGIGTPVQAKLLSLNP
ncbi:MAG: cellulase family glycosylhydrolase [Polyangiaceae bacterium]